jgi:hypothetical protein
MPIKPAKAAEQTAAKPPSGGRRTKEQLIQDAVIPPDGTLLKMKTPDGFADVPWPEAAQRFMEAGGKRNGPVDFVDTSDRYKAWKWASQQGGAEQSQASEPSPQSPAADERAKARLTNDGAVWDYVREMQHEGVDLVIFTVRGDESGGEFSLPTASWDELPAYIDPNEAKVEHDGGNPQLPSEAEPGDEVRIGSETFRVGHGGVLTSSPVADPDTGATLKPYRRWQRELGAGKDGKWEAVIVGPSYDDQVGAAVERAAEKVASKPVEEAVQQGLAAQATEAPVIEPGQSQSFTESVAQQTIDGWKVGAGFLEKIGLPEYSSIQIGPFTASRTVHVASGERYSLTRENGTVVTAPKEAIDAMIECCNACEIAARIVRSDFLSFIAAAKPGQGIAGNGT